MFSEEFFSFLFFFKFVFVCKTHAYVIISVLKLDTIELIKFSRIITARIDFQSVAFSPSSKQIDSSANFTTDGGLAIVLTSTSCCLRIDFTAIFVCLDFISYIFGMIWVVGGDGSDNCIWCIVVHGIESEESM